MILTMIFVAVRADRRGKNITATEDWNEVMRQVNDLRKRWRRIPSWESAYEEKLTEEFDSYIDAFYAKRRELYQNVQKLKEDLIKQAKKLRLRRNGIRQQRK